MNRKASTLLAALADTPDGVTVVEIGTIRFDHELPSEGYSTVYLAEQAAARGWKFHSVSDDKAATDTARSLIPEGVKLHTKDGTKWLTAFKARIDALYLDGSSDPVETLEQYRAAKLAGSCVVIVDDVQPVGEHERGKGELLLDVLAEDGFDVEMFVTEPVWGPEPDYMMAVAKR